MTLGEFKRYDGIIIQRYGPLIGDPNTISYDAVAINTWDCVSVSNQQPANMRGSDVAWIHAAEENHPCVIYVRIDGAKILFCLTEYVSFQECSA